MAKSKPSVQHEYTFRNQFLIAMPNMDDPNFCQTVTYITEHNARGALGIVINRPLDFTLTQLLKHLEIASNLPNIDRIQVCQGGPVQPDQGFVLHSPAGNWSTTLPIS